MSSERSSAAAWVIAGLLAALFACLCLVVAAGAGAFAFLQIQSSSISAPVPQQTQAATPVSTGPTATPISMPGDPAPVPEEAVEMQAELRQVLVPIADPVDLAQRLLGLEDVSRVLAESAEPVPLGTVRTFWASNVDTNENFQVEAELVYESDHVYFWVEQGVDFDQDDVERLVDEFENKIYPTNREFFGSEWSPGVDGDDHLYILFARGLGFSIAGYFNSSDSYSPQVHEYSNGHEMFYLSADNLDPAEEFTYGVLAHEFQHMIHWYLDRNEDTWMNEGFSEVATLLNDYDVGGFDFAYAAEPDQILMYWPSEPGTSSAHYGQSFLFLSYYLQRFGSDATKALVANASNGLTSVDEALSELGEIDPATGEVAAADDVYRDWAVAMLLQDGSVADGRYALTAYPGPPRVSLADDFDRCPQTDERRQVAPYGIDYIRISCEGEFDLVFEGAKVIDVVPASANSGDYAFWSNKGDESDMTLTRSFDLAGVDGPVSFDYWTWYDIEEGWDYLYLEVSADGGETWSILRTPSGTDEDPSGNSYGWAYTAKSGGGQQARWIQESIDLSTYAGEEILLRFEYVTDAAVNGEGFLLDDVSLEAIGYQADFEDGDGGWRADGFVRLFNQLPQTYRVVLVEMGSEVRVRDVPLDEARRAVMPIQIGGDVDEVFLVVTSTTRHTWQRAPYSISIIP